jgi:hypothetical protein
MLLEVTSVGTAPKVKAATAVGLKGRRGPVCRALDARAAAAAGKLVVAVANVMVEQAMLVLVAAVRVPRPRATQAVV